MLMYDSINVDAIPADAECVLVYTDGKYANHTAMSARFPNAKIQTISAVGQVVAQWIDCEVGCVWPPAAAVGVYKAWAGQGCQGFYSTTATQQALQEELAHQQISPKSVEWFNADWNNVPHIDAGDTQTQFESLPGYDVSEVPDAVPPAAPWVPGGDMNQQDVQNVTAAVQLMLRQELEPGAEAFDRVVQAVLEALGQYPVAKG